MMVFCRKLLFAALFASPACALAQQVEGGGRPVVDAKQVGAADRTRVTAVLGAAVVPSYEGSNDRRVIPAVAVFGEIDGYALSTRGTAVQLDLIRNRPGPGWDLQFGPAVTLDLNRSSAIGDARVAALGTRKAAVEVGAQLGIARNGVLSDYDTLSLGVTVVRDVTDVHGDVVVSPEVSYSTPLSRRTYVYLGASASNAGDGYARAYFDVDAVGASRSGLPRFAARGGWKSWSLSAAALHSLSSGGLGKGWGLVAGVSYSRLLGDFARSPVTAIAGSRDQLIAGAGLAYSF